MSNYIFLYGLTGPDRAYRPIRYTKMGAYISYPIASIKLAAKRMIEDYPEVKSVYVIDNSRELYEAYRDTVLNPSIENNISFKSMLEKEGICII